MLKNARCYIVFRRVTSCLLWANIIFFWNPQCDTDMYISPTSWTVTLFASCFKNVLCTLHVNMEKEERGQDIPTFPNVHKRVLLGHLQNLFTCRENRGIAVTRGLDVAFTGKILVQKHHLKPLCLHKQTGKMCRNLLPYTCIHAHIQTKCKSPFQPMLKQAKKN